MAIHFFNEESSYKLKHKSELKQWLKAVAAAEGFKIGELNYILCNDDYLHQINVDYLQHDTYTDIITFDHSEIKKEIAGDIFLSTDRVIENACIFKVQEFDELCRVLVHGALHLMGYTDKSKVKKTEMTAKEDYYLAKRTFDGK
jgi:rRNA maturation RNase YbeY